MIKVLSSEKLPIKLWLDDIEQGALDQAKNLANLPFAYRHIAIMPDSHQGYGMPIGGVMATTDEIVVPNAVGVDIGCGMCAVKTSINKYTTDDLKKVIGKVRELIPVGFGHHDKPQDVTIKLPAGEITERESSKAFYQVGTLGGGNHFIEIQKDKDGYLWLMIHSGSRNVGKQVADHYNKLANQQNRKWFSAIPKEWELAFLDVKDNLGKQYMAEMNYCVDFALANRELMMDRFKVAFIETFGLDIVFGVTINIAHNYAKFENHWGKNVIVHRKGATSARTDEVGIIPGSQGTNSYIVAGLGNSESFNSCSHGAGRKMGRKDAERRLNLKDEIAKLDKQGIIHAIRGIHDLDEAAGAYKDIDRVMANQSDLVKIVETLTPLAVVKG